MSKTQFDNQVRATAYKSGLEAGSGELVKAGSSAGLASQFQVPSLKNVRWGNGFTDSPLMNRLAASPMARNTVIQRNLDGTYTTSPMITVGTESIDDDGSTCCICGGNPKACQHSHELRPFCYYDCLENTMDVLMENSPIVGDNTLNTPYVQTGDSIAKIKARRMAAEYKFYWTRNALLGNLGTTGNGLRPFEGLLQHMADPKVFTTSGANGIQRAIKSLKCRMSLLNVDGNWGIFVNPIVAACLEDQLRNPITGNLPSGWSVNASGVLNWNGAEVIADYNVPVDTTVANGGVAWLVNFNEVGLLQAYGSDRPYIVDDSTVTNDGIDQATGDMTNCMKKCLYMYNAGAVVVGSFNGLVQITGLPVDQACLNGIAGLGGLVNPDTPFPFTN